ncbi:hypothetical protein KCMC57_up50740 [Kitasatospora sp. CMC57]|uniref:Nudix hydrolase domain-containing protein n=1 Tax=Kitasatospora sp. CMC57 TaxID=3231513 RepID=A0AB33K9V0_9ACTN
MPAGWAEPGEDPAAAVAREIEEETGWRPAQVTASTSCAAANRRIRRPCIATRSLDPGK